MLNRVISILVIVAVGVLIFPFIINHPDRALSVEMIKEPPFPGQQTQNETIQAIGTSMASKTMTDASTINIKNYKIKNHAKSKAWVIQIGASKDKITALRLVNQLRAKGYNAFIYQKGAAFGEQVNVYIGPEVKRNLAEMLATKINQEMKLSVTVRSYKPLAA